MQTAHEFFRVLFLLYIENMQDAAGACLVAFAVFTIGGFLAMLTAKKALRLGIWSAGIALTSLSVIAGVAFGLKLHWLLGNLALMAGFGFLIAMHLYLLFYAIYLVGRAIVYCLNLLAQL